jgi:hypothetical protein
MSKQTAVEWLYNELTKVWYDVKSSKELLDQALEMEKEQIVDAWVQATPRNIPKYEALTKEFAEKFYNETYKGENNA